MAQPESKLSRRIKDAIKAGGGYAVKFHGGPITEAGTPDILACIPCDVWTEDLGQMGHEVIGRFVGLETKMPDGGDPTPIQKRRHDQIRAAGGVVIVPRSVEDAIEALDALGWARPRDMTF
jgi:hypothetical protein